MGGVAAGGKPEMLVVSDSVARDRREKRSSKGLLFIFLFFLVGAVGFSGGCVFREILMMFCLMFV